MKSRVQRGGNGVTACGGADRSKPINGRLGGFSIDDDEERAEAFLKRNAGSN
jgi:hypothetical protein